MKSPSIVDLPFRQSIQKTRLLAKRNFKGFNTLSRAMQSIQNTRLSLNFNPSVPNTLQFDLAKVFKLETLFLRGYTLPGALLIRDVRMSGIVPDTITLYPS